MTLTDLERRVEALEFWKDYVIEPWRNPYPATPHPREQEQSETLRLLRALKPERPAPSREWEAYDLLKAILSAPAPQAGGDGVPVEAIDRLKCFAGFYSDRDADIEAVDAWLASRGRG